MSARFVIVVEGAGPELQNAITKYLKERAEPFWHWLEDLWLVVDESNKTDAHQIWNRLKADIPALAEKHMVVLGVDAKRPSYGGYLPDESWEWLTRYWKEESQKVASYGNS